MRLGLGGCDLYAAPERPKLGWHSRNGGQRKWMWVGMSQGGDDFGRHGRGGIRPDVAAVGVAYPQFRAWLRRSDTQSDVERTSSPGPDADRLAALSAVQRIADVVAALRIRRGDDPLLGDILNEAECLSLLAVREAASPVATSVSLSEKWPDLTSRERQVADLLAADMTDREIAEALDICPNTARGYSASVLSKLGLHSRRDLRRGVAPSARSPLRD